MIDLNTAWFILFGILIAGYAILDGFDLGVGILHLFSKSGTERRININAIGPVWDGNEVWLITAGGALFAAFPIVYATVFSGFYIALMLVLTALIARAVSMEFRGKVDSPGWRKIWDWSFSIGSFLAAVLFGVAVGNILRGVPIDANGMWAGSFLGLLNPYAILIGLLTMILFLMHGALYMAIKTEGDQCERMASMASRAWVIFVILYLLATLYTIFEAGFLFQGIISSVLFWICFILLLLSVVYLPIAIQAKQYSRAFWASSTLIAMIIGIAAVSLFPRMVPSSTNLEYSLTIYNASSTDKTLSIMLIMALIGMPLVIGYTIYIYRVFKGKTVLNEDSY